TVHFAIDGNRMEVSSANEGSWVEVYTIGGVKVASSRVQSGHANVTLGDTPGVYVIKNGHVTFKVMKK
ncbi:MAG: T9SS type A sorting domain-containing protein, partial [Bacteroidaceae bacterium]|nr:T9SS type A sorting domain-containing protein [Bacteroidaceae bacterium]